MGYKDVLNGLGDDAADVSLTYYTGNFRVGLPVMSSLSIPLRNGLEPF